MPNKTREASEAIAAGSVTLRPDGYPPNTAPIALVTFRGNLTFPGAVDLQIVWTHSLFIRRCERTVRNDRSDRLAERNKTLLGGAGKGKGALKV